jgi:hypothetical protein
MKEGHREKKSPLKTTPLRDAGQSLSEEIDKLLNEKALMWVFKRMFGPSKFAGFKSMTFPVYEAAVQGKTIGSRFDGSLTRRAIEEALGYEYREDPPLSEQLVTWAEGILGRDALDGIDGNKWCFVSLPREHRLP